MKKIITRYPILNIVLGVLLIVFAVYGTFIDPIIESGIRYVIAAIIVVYSLFRFYKDLIYYKQPLVKGLVAGELAIYIFLAMLLVIETIDIATTLGLVLYLKGALYMLLLLIRKVVSTIERYVINLALITLGAYIFFTQTAFIDYLVYVIFVLLTLYGALLLGFGIKKLIEQWKVKQAQKPKKVPPKTSEPKTSEPKKETPNPTSVTYTKNRLMEKPVSELKEMCKARNMKGYSTLKKDELVEKLWLYEQDA